MFNLLSLKPDAFGIDISGLSVKLVKLKKANHGFDLASYNQESIELGVIENGEIKKSHRLAMLNHKIKRPLRFGQRFGRSPEQQIDISRNPGPLQIT